MNEATRFINPTKALEYMATGRSIVSTPVEDVVAQFSDVITIAHDVRTFANACERAAVQPDVAANRARACAGAEKFVGIDCRPPRTTH